MQEWVLGERVSTILQLIVGRHKSPSSLVVRASDRGTESHGFDFPWTLSFFFAPRLGLTQYSIFLISPPGLNFIIIFFLIIIRGGFDIADPSSMQAVCPHEPGKYDLARHESPSCSVVRASDRCTGGHGFDSC